ncbi:circadian locomoter output cycles protein kaput-like isoform X2 [Macrobrachium rosenbergii]|uniref:circadian locomoter output cycles protein kaput-like isoform X2 n=1 Tax=Macrobrachium rosenbergii TaxID=79674 RepID=UPI0034D76C9A
MLFLTDVVTPGKSTSNLETTVSQESQSSHQQESQSSHQQESQTSNQQDSQTSNQQDSQLSQSLLVQVDSYQSDDEVVHEPFNYDSSVDEIDLLTPAFSHTVPGTSRSSSSSPRNKETWGRTRTPKRKRNMTPERAPSATE